MDSKSKYIDLNAVLQIIGCVYNNIDLLEKYSIKSSDFTLDFHKVVFGCMIKLYDSGVKKITIHDIEEYLAKRPNEQKIYTTNEGGKFLTDVSAIAQNDNFDYYYTRLKKFSLLRAYDDLGVDVSFIYDPANVLDIVKRQKQENYLENSSLEELITAIDIRLSEVKEKFAKNLYSEHYQAGSGLKDLIAKFKKTPDVGSPLYGGLVNTVTRGARLKKFYLRSAPTGWGKAIPDYTLIPTPLGFRRVGDIRPGDYLFDRTGKPTKVLQIHPQPQEKEIWKVTFLDGRVAECCEDHLWEYWYDSHRGKASRVESVKQIYERSLKLKNGLKTSEGRGYRFQVRNNQAVEYEEKNYSVHPFVMGALLGDGSFRYSSMNKALTFSSMDDELPNRIANLLGDKIIAKKSSELNYLYTFKNKNDLKHNLWVEEILKDYSSLWQTKSENKFIPNEYLQGSIEQRYELLRGLLDTDGGIDSKGRISFTTISEKIANNVMELTRSLGMIPTITMDKREEKYAEGKCYRINIQCKKELKDKLFTLERKKKIAIDYINNGKREEYKEFNSIVSIEKTSQKTSMTCFTVDNEEHLFLMNDFIVTHNTRMMIADVCSLACDMIYDERFGWIKNGPKQPTLYISTELELDEVQTMMLAFLSNVEEQHIVNAEYEGDEEERVAKAIEILEASPLFVEIIPDFTLRDIEDTIRRNIRENGVKYIGYDYLHTSLGILSEITKSAGGVKLREDNVLFMLSIKIKDLCNQYGVFIISSTQLNADYATSQNPDQNLLRGAKAIAD